MSSKRDRMREMAQKRAGLNQRETLVEEIADQLGKEPEAPKEEPPVKVIEKAELPEKPKPKKKADDRGIRQTSFKLMPENIRYVRYRSKAEHVQILDLIAGIIEKDMSIHQVKNSVPDFSAPLGDHLKRNSSKAEYFSVRIYNDQWSYLSNRAMFTSQTASSYLDDLLTEDREEYVNKNT